MATVKELNISPVGRVEGDLDVKVYMENLHGLKWDQALSYAKRILGPEYPDDIQVYLVAIDDTRLEIQMSDAARAAGDRVVDLIVNELQPVSHEPSAVENLAPVD